MEALSTASGVIAIVSITIQLADSIKKLCDFWSNVKDAPEEITAMVSELRLLDLVLKKIHENEQRYGTDPTTTAVLKRCAEKVNALVAAMDSFQPGFASQKWQVRTWNGFKVTLQSKKFQGFRLSLEEMKTTLILARQDLSERMQYTFQDQNVTAINDGFAGLQLRRSSTTVTTAFAGPSDLNDHIVDLRSEIERMTTAISNPWLKAGLQMGMDKAVQDLVASLKTNPISRRSTEPVPISPTGRTNSFGGAVERDVEQGNLSGPKMPPLLRKRSRRRYLEGTYTSITSNFFGMSYFTTRKYQIKIGSQRGSMESPIDHYEYETHFIIHPAQWLLRWGLNFGLDFAITRSIKGWKNNIRTFRAVLDNSLIFDFCRDGNIQGVRSLLSRGEASPWDTNSQGWTPLHLASWTCNLELCKLLLEAGADKTALTYDFTEGNYEMCSPLVTASTMSRHHAITPIQRVNTLRLFLSDLETDFTDSESQEWNMILVLLERERPSSNIALNGNTDVSAWVLDTFKDDIKGDHPMDKIAWLMTFSLEVEALTEKVLDVSNNMVDATFGEDGFTAVHAKIAEGFPDTVIPSMKVLARRGADLHLVGCTTGYGANGMPMHDSATSLAMRRSAFFAKWRSLLRELNIDFDFFVREELARNEKLVEEGWTQVSLRQLFDAEFEVVEMERYYCAKCAREVYRTYEIREEWWESLLKGIRGDSGVVEDGEESFTDTFNSARTAWSAENTDDDAEKCDVAHELLEEVPEIERLLCWKCGIMEEVRTSGHLKREVNDEDKRS